MSEHPITEALVECAKAWESMGFDFEREATCNAIKEITRLREALEDFKKQYPLSPWIIKQVDEALQESDKERESD